jgi:acyl carrier protein
MDIRTQVVNVVRALAEDSQAVIDDQALIASLGIDSMDLMDLIFQIQELCEVEFSDKDLLPSNLATVGSIIKTVEKLRGDSHE